MSFMVRKKYRTHTPNKRRTRAGQSTIDITCRRFNCLSINILAPWQSRNAMHGYGHHADTKVSHAHAVHDGAAMSIKYGSIVSGKSSYSSDHHPIDRPIPPPSPLGCVVNFELSLERLAVCGGWQQIQSRFNDSFFFLRFGNRPLTRSDVQENIPNNVKHVFCGERA